MAKSGMTSGTGIESDIMVVITKFSGHSMRYKIALLLTTVVLTGSLVGCTQIKLSGNKQPAANTGGTGGGQQPAQQQPSQPQPAGAPPSMTGEWELTYTVNDQQVQAGVMIAQEGTALQGQGTDQSGDEWQILNGQVNGNQITFVKKVTVRNGQQIDGIPVNYTGILEYHNDPEYNGWLAQGTYSFAKADGSEGKGDWLAVPKTPLGEVAADAPPPQMIQPEPPAPVQAAAPIGNTKPRDISGRYSVKYAYNFKKMNSKMWLKHDGEPLTKPNLSGDGIDTTTGEKFEITKGWYAYPNITLHRQYTKGKGAKQTRLIIFQGKVSSDGRTIKLQGETQFGGTWEATLAR